jgi:hypothetical protein
MSAVLSSSPWYADLESIRSRGSQTARPGSLAGLHETRKLHHGQFFTSPALVEFVWRYVDKLDACRLLRNKQAGRLALFDNACGNGRLFWPADPARHVLYGCDIDGQTVAQLAGAVAAAGFEARIVNAGMEEIGGVTAHIGLLNPPFGLTLKSPFLEPTPGVTTWGPHGPHTSALSQSYAIAQALASCEIVLAIVPTSYVDTLMTTSMLADRLRGVLHLPPGLFREEGTDVRVSLACFGAGYSRTRAEVVELDDLTGPLHRFGLELSSWHKRTKGPKVRTVEDSAPVTTTPVTGDNRVWISHSGRKIFMRFACGLTEAKCRNGLLNYRVTPREGQRLPAGVRYAGQGWFDIENLLGTEGAEGNLTRLLTRITEAGGAPLPSASLVGYYRKRLRRDRVRREPFRRWAYTAGVPDMADQPIGCEAAATVKVSHITDPSIWNSPVLRAGEPVTLRVIDAGGDRAYQVERGGRVLATHTLEDVRRKFTAHVEAYKGWRLVHEGRRVAFPELAAARTRLAESLGLREALHWDPASGESCYQFDDLVELCQSDRGIAAWSMGAGKARLGVALCLMGGAHNLIVVESHLVPELVDEIGKIGLPADMWQVIESPDQLDDLRKVNVISYAKLRAPLCRGAGRRTYASRLRRRLHTVVADEAHCVRNRATAQTQALWKLSPKKRYAMTGTPIANYCRDALPLIIWAGGDGIATQRYGEHQPLIDELNLKTMQESQRGLDAFREKFVSLEWAVREFEEDLREGAKREVPRLRNVEAFRELLAPHVLRRVMGEPELARWIRVPEPSRHVHEIQWDPKHLQVYLRNAWEFADWYREIRRKAGDDGNVNLVAVLAHINQVFKATNVPHMLDGPAGAYGPDTSKQRYALDLVKKFVGQGKKTVLYATNPAVLERLARRLEADGIESVLYHGGIPIAKRTRELNRRFRNGSAMVLLIALGCGQTGLNLPQASRMIFLNRGWTPKSEEQSGHRVLRPQQADDVEFHYLHLAGSIDEYQAMHVAHKQDATNAGLDYGEQEIAEGEFLHLTTVIGQFCEDLVTRWGLQHHHDLIEALDHAA